MSYDPQPFVATQSGPAGNAPRGAKPIALYGVEGGGTPEFESLVEGEINRLDNDITELAGVILGLTSRIEALETPAG